MRGRIAKKISKRIDHRTACLAGACQGWIHNGSWYGDNEKCKKCKYGKDVAWKVNYPNRLSFQNKVDRIAERCYTQYNLCLKVWALEGWKPDLPEPRLHSLAMIAAKRYGWTERKAVFNMVDLFNEIRFKNRRNKDYRDEPT